MSPDLDNSPPDGEDVLTTLIDRYWRGEISPAEAARVDAWFQAHPEQRALYAQVGGELKAGIAPNRAPEEWAQLEAAILTSALRPDFTEASKGERSRSATSAGVGRILAFPQRSTEAHAKVAGPATVKKLFKAWPERRFGVHSFRRAVGFGGVLGAVILLGGVGAYLVRRAPSARQNSAVATPVPMIETATTRGQRATIRLADGTRVILGVASRIRYLRTFGETTREIDLEGEAYFDVVHDARMPFRVRTAQGMTEDIGTRFDVRSYPGDTASRIVVEEGKVAVGAHVTLGAGDVAHVMANGAPVVQHGVRVEHLLSWTRGHLEFANVSVREALRDLQRWYGIDIRVQDPALARRTITASFQDVPVREVLDFMTKALDARLEQHSATNLLVPQRPTGHPASSHAISPPTSK